ncbi:MAG: hypothetical protein L0Z62_13785 [Gemmataceae bacterium]|nr:hypothetical protein [Gemmataceae bacterium]
MLEGLSQAIGAVTAAGIRTWVRLTGKRIARREAAWLECPMGPRGRIGSEFYTRLAEQQQLKLLPALDHGLLPDFTTLRGIAFDPERVCPEVRDFYEHTSCYRLEAWSEAPVLTRTFLWALTRFVSRRMDQLNFPVSSLELAGGMTSEVLPMVAESGELVYTGWLRRLATDGRVIYTGLYSTGRPGAHPDPCVKVTFPLPLGSATVFLRPEAQPDGSFKLISSGSRFGDPGFYRMVEAGPDHWRVRYIRTLRETFHVYLDRQGILRTSHVVRFLGLTVLRLHYKLERVRPLMGRRPGAGEGGVTAGQSSLTTPLGCPGGLGAQ